MSDKDVYVYYHHISSFYENIEIDIVICFAFKTLYAIVIKLQYFGYLVIIISILMVESDLSFNWFRLQC